MLYQFENSFTCCADKIGEHCFCGWCLDKEVTLACCLFVVVVFFLFLGGERGSLLELQFGFFK